MNRLLHLLLACIAALAANGQNTLRPNLYFQNQNLNYYNPAAGFNTAETSQALTLYGKYKSVASPVWDKPMTFFANYLGRKGDAGFYAASLLRDSYSFFNRTGLSVGYTRQYKVLNGRTLSLGGRAIFNFDRLKWGEAPQFGQTGSSTRVTPDLDLGLQYEGNRLRVGVSVKNAFGSAAKLDGATLLKNQREGYLNASFALVRRENFTLSPYALLQLNRDFGVDGGLYLSLYRRLNLSYLFQLSELRSVFTAEANLTKNLRVGFAAGPSRLYRDTDFDFLVGINF